ncbi:MAG: sirohydrochlorin cobaltochelatase [Bacillota bacterium]|nr:sirohydrochlorin cobaltochelatase [Bacillota bacterium]
MSDIRTDRSILVVSFGTLHKETCDRTIGAIEETLAGAFPDRKLYRAWTSGFIIKRLRARGEDCLTLDEALDSMEADGINDVLVQPTHLLDGYENRRMKDTLGEYADRFESVCVGEPLLGSGEDIEKVAQIIRDEIRPACGCGTGRSLVLMGHGSADDPSANHVYDDLQEALTRSGARDVYVGTVEGAPSLEDVISRMDTDGAGNETAVTPLMIVAGNHALNDMAGYDEGSWQNVLSRTGREVTAVIKGLGEYRGIREMFTAHASQAKALK